MNDTDINDLLKAFDNPHHCFPQHLVDAIRLLVKERDDARRMACEKEETLGCDERGVPRNGSARDHAKQRGWDCFKEDSND